MSHSLKRKLSYSDLPTTHDGRRFELIRGELFVNPSPNKMHQRVSYRLQRQLEDYFHPRRLGEVFDAPTDVILTDHDVFVPDLAVAPLDDASERAIERPPLLVVEIASPSTKRLDRKLKFERYAELEVMHYWIVDAQKKRIDCFKLEKKTFVLSMVAEGDKRFDPPDFEGLSIDLEALWLPSPAS
jgi:Uma2 family endonuclease